MNRLMCRIFRRPACVILLAVMAAALAGCKRTSAPPPLAAGGFSEGQAKYRSELLQSALSLLSSPEQFDDEQQASTQLVERLNQWIRMARGTKEAETSEPGKETPAPQRDESQDNGGAGALIETLPETYRLARWLRGLDREVFDAAYDGEFLRETALLRDVANHVQTSGRDDLSLAQALFDWTVRNVQLEPQPVDDSSPEEKWIALHLPLESLYYGRATPLGRAWVFMLLARQAGLDVVLLATPDPRDPQQVRPWVTALVSEGQLYLFDYTYGLPVPGPGGNGIATLAQAAADESVLRQMDIPGGRIYPRKAADLASVTALVEGSPGYLSKRMRLLDAQLAGRDRLVLSIDGAELAGELRGMKHVGAVKLWELPYQTLQARSAVKPGDPLERAMVLERMPFSIPAEPEQTSTQSDSRRRPRPVYALRIGRLLQLRGLFGATESSGRPGEEGVELSAIAERGAKYYYLRAMPTQEQLEDLERMQREGAEILPGRRLSKEFIDATRAMRDDAVYWLGLISLEQGGYQTASQYLGAMTLDADPDGPWTNGAQFNLAQAYEAMGKTAEAIKLYEADRSPQRYGNRLRAVRLKSREAGISPTSSGTGTSQKRD